MIVECRVLHWCTDGVGLLLALMIDRKGWGGGGLPTYIWTLYNNGLVFDCMYEYRSIVVLFVDGDEEGGASSVGREEPTVTLGDPTPTLHVPSRVSLTFSVSSQGIVQSLLYGSVLSFCFYGVCFVCLFFF